MKINLNEVNGKRRCRFKCYERVKYEKAIGDATKLRKELDETYAQCQEIQSRESGLKEQVKTIETKV